MAAFAIGDQVFLQHRNEIGLVQRYEGFDSTFGQDKYRVRIGRKKEAIVFLERALQAVTPEIKEKAAAWSYVNNPENSRSCQVYLQLLRQSGSAGVMNDCLCEKDPLPAVSEFADVLGNRACSCITLNKLNHRFSVYKENFVKLGYVIEDIKTDNGKHKTILHKEPC